MKKEKSAPGGQESEKYETSAKGIKRYGSEKSPRCIKEKILKKKNN